MLGGGKCLVSFTPEIAKIHTIEVSRPFLTPVTPVFLIFFFSLNIFQIKFNGETVPGT